MQCDSSRYSANSQVRLWRQYHIDRPPRSVAAASVSGADFCGGLFGLGCAAETQPGQPRQYLHIFNAAVWSAAVGSISGGVGTGIFLQDIGRIGAGLRRYLSGKPESCWRNFRKMRKELGF